MNVTHSTSATTPVMYSFAMCIAYLFHEITCTKGKKVSLFPRFKEGIQTCRGDLVVMVLD